VKLGCRTRDKSIYWDMAVHVGSIAAVAAIVWFAGSDRYEDNNRARAPVRGIEGLFLRGLVNHLGRTCSDGLSTRTVIYTRLKKIATNN
jgi:hypothetical protein